MLAVKNLPANAGDARSSGLIPGSGRSSGGRHGNPLQNSCLESPTVRGGLAGYSPRSHTELGMTEAAEHAHTLGARLKLVWASLELSVNGLTSTYSGRRAVSSKTLPGNEGKILRHSLDGAILTEN